MSIDSHGYQVMSLRELIAELQRRADDQPASLDKPVWVANCPPLYWPVKAIAGDASPNGAGVRLYVERGGN